jgi:5-methylcytosine-specific restriction endonuclease McrA
MPPNKGLKKGPYRRRPSSVPRAPRLSWSERVTLTPEWAAWRKQVFQRDGYRCIMCPRTPAAALAFRALRKHLEPHHIRRKIDFPQLMYEVDNGVTLCNSCHKMVTGSEAAFEAQFLRYISRLRAREAELYSLNGFDSEVKF